MIRCCVIDDEHLAAALIAKYVERTPFLQLCGVYNCAADAMKAIKEQQIQLLMLDIEMPQLNGLEFAKILPPECRVIFITAYDRYAVQGFRVNAVDYLLKPVSYEEFLEAANRARHEITPIDTPEPEFISVKCEYENRRILLDDISLIEGEKNYIKIHLTDSSQVLTLMTMKAMEQMLPSNFIRVHRSYIVNLDHVTSVRTSRIRLSEIFVPIGDTYRATLRERLGPSPGHNQG